MKRLILCLGMIGISACPAWRARSAEVASKTPELMVRVDFAGFDRLRTGTNATTLREILELPASVELRNQTLDKIAQALAGVFQPPSKAAPDERARLIRPLLDDLWRTEWHAELSGTGSRVAVWALALRLDEEHARIWRTNLSQLASDGSAELERAGKRIRFHHADSWFAVGTGPNATEDSSGSGAIPSLLKRIQSDGPATAGSEDGWLKARLALPRLAQWLGRSHAGRLPEVDLAVSGRGATVRTQARLTFPEPANWRLEPWQIPVHTIRDPQNSLISFTALQGFAPWLSRQPWWRELALSPVPNQYYVWGQSDLPFQIQAAFPVVGPTNWLNRISSLWLPRFNTNLAEHAVGEIRSLPNRAGLLWRGLPMIIPYLQPAPEPAREFLWGGIFPVDAPTNPPPAALLAQLTDRTNLLYYNWEITQSRLAQLRPLAQLFSVVTTLPAPSTNSPSQKWLDAIEAKLGNAVTEITVQSPRELTFVRNAHAGLNGVELLTLAYWLDSMNFPGWDFRPGFRPIKNFR